MCSTVCLCVTLLFFLSDTTAQKSNGNMDGPDIIYPSDDYYDSRGRTTPETTLRTKVSSQTSTKSNTSEGCLLPALPPGVKHFVDLYAKKVVHPGEAVANYSYAVVKCIDGYDVAIGFSDSVKCWPPGEFAMEIPQCYKLCPEVRLEKNVNYGFNTPSQRFNSTITVKCKEFYSSTSSERSVTTTCGLDGRWSRPPVLSQPCEPDCGLSNIKPQNKASSEKQAAKLGDFPWHAAIYHKIWEGQYDYACSGVLITVRLVITKYQCAMKETCEDCHIQVSASDVIVNLGKLLLDFTSREKTVVRRSVKEISLHKISFALLILDSEVELSNRFVIPACFRLKNDFFEEEFASPTQNVFVSGWGRYNCTPGDTCQTTADNKLHYAHTQQINQYTIIFETFHGYKQEDAVADRGSGLVIHHKNKYHVIGIFAYYSGKGATQSQVYLKLSGSEYIEWISEIIRRTSDKPACTLPEYRHNEYKVPGCSEAACSPGPGDKVDDGQTVLISCHPGYHVTSSHHTHSECQQGNWTLPIPKCDNLCPSLVSTTLNLECYLGLKRTICSEPQSVDTTVRMSCKQHYTLTASGNIRHIRCLQNGTWSRDLPRCEPVCGQSDLVRATHTPTIVGGKAAKTSNFPWNAALFLKDKGKWTTTVQCGGSLITTRAVLTAAHCVTETNYIDKPRVLPTSDVAVALGKVHRRWGYMEDTEVNKTVQEIVAHSAYRGSPANYHADIAILILSSEVEATRYISPVCLDLNKNIYRDLTSPSKPGYVVGWGHTVDCPINQCNSPSNTLLYTRTEVLPYHECTNKVQKAPPDSPNLLPRIDADKLCSGNGSESVIQGGDSGGGLVYVFGDQFFIYGVVSNKLRVEKQYSFGLFTNVTEYTDWITDIISRDA